MTKKEGDDGPRVCSLQQCLSPRVEDFASQVGEIGDKAFTALTFGLHLLHPPIPPHPKLLTLTLEECSSTASLVFYET